MVASIAQLTLKVDTNLAKPFKDNITYHNSMNLVADNNIVVAGIGLFDVGNNYENLLGNHEVNGNVTLRGEKQLIISPHAYFNFNGYTPSLYTQGDFNLSLTPTTPSYQSLTILSGHLNLKILNDVAASLDVRKGAKLSILSGSSLTTNKDNLIIHEGANIELQLDAKIKFTHNDVEYSLEAKDSAIDIHDIDELVKLGDFVSSHYNNESKIFEVPMEHYAGLRHYNTFDKNLLNEFLKQNYKFDHMPKLDDFIKENNFEIFKISSNDSALIDSTESPFHNLDANIAGEIFKYIEEGDILN